MLLEVWYTKGFEFVYFVFYSVTVIDSYVCQTPWEATETKKHTQSCGYKFRLFIIVIVIICSQPTSGEKPLCPNPSVTAHLFENHLLLCLLWNSNLHSTYVHRSKPRNHQRGMKDMKWILFKWIFPGVIFFKTNGTGWKRLQSC